MKNTVLAAVLVERRMLMITLVSEGLSTALSLVVEEWAESSSWHLDWFSADTVKCYIVFGFPEHLAGEGRRESKHENCCDFQQLNPISLVWI